MSSGLHRLEEALEAVLPLGELHHLGVGAAELEPDLHHALGGLLGDLLDARRRICSAIDLASSSRTLSLVAFGLHLVGDDGQHAVAEVPDVLGDEDEADAARHHRHAGGCRIEPTMRWPMREAMLASCAAHHQHHRAGDAFAAFRSAPGRSRHGRRPCRGRCCIPCRRRSATMRATVGAVAAAEKGLHALRRRAGRVDGGELDALADLLAERPSPGLDGLLHRLGAVDALGGGGGELLRPVSREASDDHSLNQLDSSRTSPMARSTSRSMMSSMLPRRHSSATSDLVVDVGERRSRRPLRVSVSMAARKPFSSRAWQASYSARVMAEAACADRDLRQSERGCGQAGDGWTNVAQGCAHKRARL